MFKYVRIMIDSYWRLFFACFLVIAGLSAHAHADSNEIVDGQIIVKYQEDIDLGDRRDRAQVISLEKTNGLEKIDEIKEENIRLLQTDLSVESIIEDLQDDPQVESIEPNLRRHSFVTSDDTFFNYLWSFHNTAQNINGVGGSTDADMDVPEGWDLFSSLSFQSIPVAVIDTGIRHDHNDLAANMWNGAACKDDLGALKAGGCPNHGWDYCTNDNNPMDDGDEYGDDRGHGTHVAGIIGAVANNTYGSAGVSLQNSLKLMALRFDFTTYSEIKAINFAKYNGAKVINASYGGESYSALEKNAIASFSGIFVTAAGNGGDDGIGDNNDTVASYPCAYDSANIICVAATDQNDNLTTFSNYGTASVDVAAPGKNNISTYANSTSSFAYMSGTSMASPQVAGLAAVLYSVRPDFTAQRIKSLVLNSGDRLTSLASKSKTGKRINLHSALSEIDDVTGPTLSALSPSGTINTQRQDTSITLSTNENSVCRYSSINTAYDSMTTTFSTTGHTTHSSKLSNIAANSNYSFYVKCRDLAGNDNASTASVSFATGSAFIPGTPAITSKTSLNRISLKLNHKNRSKSKTLRLSGNVSSQLSNGKVKIYQGKRRYALRKTVKIGAGGKWGAKFKAKKGSSFLKLVYYAPIGTQLKLDGPYYLLTKK